MRRDIEWKHSRTHTHMLNSELGQRWQREEKMKNFERATENDDNEIVGIEQFKRESKISESVCLCVLSSSLCLRIKTHLQFNVWNIYYVCTTMCCFVCILVDYALNMNETVEMMYSRIQYTFMVFEEKKICTKSKQQTEK